MTKYKLTKNTKIINDITLYQIELIEDCKWGNKGDKGGWIEKIENLQENAWVYGNARVFGNAWVSGDARVYGNARVSGDAWVYGNAWEVSPLQIQGSMHFFNECKKGIIKIGCKEFDIEYWSNNFEIIGIESGYSDIQIKEYGLYIELAKKLSNLKNK